MAEYWGEVKEKKIKKGYRGCENCKYKKNDLDYVCSVMKSLNYIDKDIICKDWEKEND